MPDEPQSQPAPQPETAPVDQPAPLAGDVEAALKRAREVQARLAGPRKRP